MVVMFPSPPKVTVLLCHARPKLLVRGEWSLA